MCRKMKLSGGRSTTIPSADLKGTCSIAKSRLKKSWKRLQPALCERSTKTASGLNRRQCLSRKARLTESSITRSCRRRFGRRCLNRENRYDEEFNEPAKLAAEFSPGWSERSARNPG